LGGGFFVFFLVFCLCGVGGGGGGGPEGSDGVSVSADGACHHTLPRGLESAAACNARHYSSSWTTELRYVQMPHEAGQTRYMKAGCSWQSFA